MLRNIEIENFKSIEKISFELGRTNVFIGENGAGKSNILEAIALAGAAEARKLDSEFLTSRGIRLTVTPLMRSAFEKGNVNRPITVCVSTEEKIVFKYTLTHNNKPYSTWDCKIDISSKGSKSYVKEFSKYFLETIKNLEQGEQIAKLRSLEEQLERALRVAENAGRGESINISVDVDPVSEARFASESNSLNEFVIYSPENSALRNFEREGQIEPLGVNGEGLLKLLQVLATSKDKSSIKSVKNALTMLSWFEDFSIIKHKSRTSIELFDRYIDKEVNGLDQRSANEGFLFVTFYFALFASRLTPKVFAIDNIDASLNPKLCEAMMRQLVKLSDESGKQAILTTHNPAILDGLDLRDDEQRLFVVSRNLDGKTRVRRYNKPLPADVPTRMSELFLGGFVGGLPKSF